MCPHNDDLLGKVVSRVVTRIQVEQTEPNTNIRHHDGLFNKSFTIDGIRLLTKR